MTAMMFAESPHQQHPHQFNLPLYSPQPQLSSSGHGQFFLDDVQAPFRKSIPFLDASNQRLFLRQTQYALPLQSHQRMEEGGQNGKVPAQSLRAEMGEHMLRRKTPNGTLSAGYDGTPVEWNSRPHADKHFLITTTDAARYNTHQLATFPIQHIQASYDGQVVLNQMDKPAKAYWQAQSSQPPSRYAMNNDVGTPAQIWLQSGSRQPIDSMLYQVPQTPMSFVNSGGYQHVPTVLQPIWAPTIGLTASNAQGRFGPYWPDGSFEPYRPDALRDLQFLPQCNNINFNNQFEAYNRQQQSNSNSPYLTPNENEFVFWNGQGFQDVRRHSGTAVSPAASGGVRSYDAGSRQQGDPNASFAQRARAMSARVQRHGSEASLWPQMPNSGQLAQLAMRTPASPSNPHFKTRVLVWAHRIYINLIQHSRRQNQAKSSNEKTHSIFPKPPRHSYSNPRDTSTLRSLNQQNLPNFRTADHLKNDNSESASQANEFASFSQWSSSKQRSSFHERHDRGLRLNPSIQNRAHASPIDVHHSPMFTSNPTTPSNPMLASPQHAVLEAQRALEILDSLCQDSSWQWVDGILLGGCLAYGLEQFQAALQWYDRVLACDPKSVMPYFRRCSYANTVTVMWRPFRIPLPLFFPSSRGKRPSNTGLEQSSSVRVILKPWSTWLACCAATKEVEKPSKSSSTWKTHCGSPKSLRSIFPGNRLRAAPAIKATEHRSARTKD